MPPRTGAAPKIDVHRCTTAGPTKLILVRSIRGRKSERPVGPRTWLSLDEAAAVLERPAAIVMESIRAGFLRARRQGRRVSVTLTACEQFLREEQDDLAYVRARRKQRTYPAEEVHAELGL